MNKLTQGEIILKLLKEKKDWIPSWEIIKVNTVWGWLGTSADRAARTLVEDGIIQRKREGKYTYYRILENKQPNLL